jgi:AcrR family transcriptional regulator
MECCGKARSPRVTTRTGREAFFQAARDILVARGADGVTVAALCSQAHLTHGSFYYHFETMAGFVEAFATSWEQEWIDKISDAAGQPDPIRCVELLAGAVLTMPLRLEATIRGWAKTNDVLAASVRRGDAAAIAAASDALAAILGDADRAAALAHMANALVVGLLMQQDQATDSDRFVTSVLEWFHANAGIDAVLTADGSGLVVRATPKFPDSQGRRDTLG